MLTKKEKYIKGEYITPLDVGLFMDEDINPKVVNSWDDVATPLVQGYRLVISKKIIKKGAENIFQMGAINPFGKLIIPMEYDFISHCSENTFTVSKNSQYALKDIDNNYIIPFGIYDFMGSMNEGVVSVSKNDKVGFIDRFSRVIIDFQYDSIFPNYNMPIFKFGCCAIRQQGKYGVIDHMNNVLLPFVWDSANIMSGDRIIVYCNDNEETGIANFKGEWVLPPDKRTIVPIYQNLWREVFFDDSICPFLIPDGVIPRGEKNVLEYWQYVLECMELHNNLSIDKVIENVRELREFVQTRNNHKDK